MNTRPGLPSPRPHPRTLLKRAVLLAGKRMGLFHIARRMTRNQLRIICYHGIALSDEAEFRPQLFITPERLAERFALLQRHGFPVLDLDHALDALDADHLPPCPVVITIDDGFHSIRRPGLDLLREFRFPATVYLTSYYVVKEQPVFGLVVAYAFWKTHQARLDLGGLGLPRSGIVNLANRPERQQVMNEIVSWGETVCNEPGRSALARELAQRLDVDYATLERNRSLSLLTIAEVRELVEAGLDMQLHTHRHRFPADPALACRELEDNRAALAPIVTRPLVHFCYPSGLRLDPHDSILRAAGIRSAATCEPGLNDRQTHRLALHRFLDGANISEIEFEAEVFGFSEILRRARRRLAG